MSNRHARGAIPFWLAPPLMPPLFGGAMGCMDFICAGGDLRPIMFTNLSHPSSLLVVNLLIVAAEIGGAVLVAAVVFAIRSWSSRPVAVRIAGRHA
jgi:hypothetical protein